MTEFHGSYRAPHDSRPLITVDCGVTAMKMLLIHFGLVTVDFAVGEPGDERVVLQVSKPGTYKFPEIVEKGTPISVRPNLDNPRGVEVRLNIKWQKPS